MLGLKLNHVSKRGHWLTAGARLNIKMSSYRYRNSHYLWNWNIIPDKTVFILGWGPGCFIHVKLFFPIPTFTYDTVQYMKRTSTYLIKRMYSQLYYRRTKRLSGFLVIKSLYDFCVEYVPILGDFYNSYVLCLRSIAISMEFVILDHTGRYLNAYCLSVVTAVQVHISYVHWKIKYKEDNEDNMGPQ